MCLVGKTSFFAKTPALVGHPPRCFSISTDSFSIESWTQGRVRWEERRTRGTTALSVTLSVKTPLSSAILGIRGKDTGFGTMQTELDLLLSLNPWVALAKALTLAETTRLILDRIEEVYGAPSSDRPREGTWTQAFLSVLFAALNLPPCYTINTQIFVKWMKYFLPEILKFVLIFMN